jgi:cytochrome c553
MGKLDRSARRGRRHERAADHQEANVRILTWATLVAATTLAAMPAAGQDDQALARSLAATCANCHGTGGVSQGTVASLAGQPKAEIVRKMQEFRDGKRPATIMHQLAKGYTEQQIDLVAGWFAAQKAQ